MNKRRLFAVTPRPSISLGKSRALLTATVMLSCPLLIASSAFAQAFPCDNEVVIDFESLTPGTVVRGQLGAEGVALVSALNRSDSGPDTAVVFDSSDPTGGDDDLGTPHQSFGGPGRGAGDGNDTALGNILIVAEDVDDDNQDGLVDDPDDSAVGGDILFTLASPAFVKSATFVDVETKGVSINGFEQDNDLSFQAEVTPSTNNSAQILDFSALNQTLSERILITLRESSALGEITLCVPSTSTATSKKLRIESACGRKGRRARASKIGRRRLRRVGRDMRKLLSREGRRKLRRGRC